MMSANGDKYPSYPVVMIDDESESLDSLEITLKSNGINNIVRCQDGRKARSLLASSGADAILLDLGMPEINGEEVLRQISLEQPGIPVIIVTGQSDLDKAVQCMQSGAFDYMVKPVEPSRLLSGLKRAIEARGLARENTLLKETLLSRNLRDPGLFANIITNSPAMHSIFLYVEAIAGTSQCVTVTGETGVGKELIVRALHNASRRTGELVSVNVAGLDDQMFSDTLFGHSKGAFTGAEKTRSGLVEKAGNGTLFLDEIGDLSPASQAKLLRLLQEKEYFQLGSDEPRRTNARVIVATCHDLAALQQQGKYRRDLYYRLMTHHIHLPSLKERADTDIAVLVDHFLDKAARDQKKERPTAPPEIVQLLRTYEFPGNIREMEGMIFDAVSRHTARVLSLESIRAHIMQHRGSTTINSITVEDSVSIVFPKPLPTIKQATRLLIEAALKESNGNQNLAAQLLGISPQALGQRLKRGESETV